MPDNTLHIALVLIVAFYMAYRAPRLAVRWREVYRLYAGIPWSLAADMWRYTGKSPLKYLRTGTVVLVVLGVGGGAFVHYEGWTLRALVAMGLGALALVALVGYMLPPTMLVVTDSNRTSNHLVSELVRRLPNYRAVTLLRPNERMHPTALWRFFTSNFRTEVNYEWRSVVFHLMDVVPIIVLDTAAASDATREEHLRIMHKGYGKRTICLAPAGIAPSPDPNSRQPAHDLDKLESAIRSRLAKLDDHEERRQRQGDFTAMQESVSSWQRYPADLGGLIVKARVLERNFKRRFLRHCKGIDSNDYGGEHFESLPSIVPRETERKFREESRDLEEVAIILRSARETVENEDDRSRTFNIANCDNSLGALARLRGEWDNAIQSIEKAIAGMRKLGSDTQYREKALGELDTAYHNLGEVYLGRYRENGKIEDRESAHRSFRYALELQRQSGAENALTQRMLAVV